jgi:hypothetical protein
MDLVEWPAVVSNNYFVAQHMNEAKVPCRGEAGHLSIERFVTLGTLVAPWFP